MILIYFKGTVREIFLILFFWFYIFIDFFFVFVFRVSGLCLSFWFLELFDVSFILLNPNAMDGLHPAYERAYCFKLTLVGFSWVFCMRFAIIWSNFQFSFIEFWDYLLYCLSFRRNQVFDFDRNSTDCLPHDARSGCGESQNRLRTVLYLLFFFLLVLYFYVAPLRVFSEQVSC